MKKNKIWISLLFLGMISFLFLPTTQAKEFNPEKKSSLTLFYEIEEVDTSDVSFSLYQVAYRKDSKTYEITKDFQKYPIVLKEENFKDLAFTLEGYVFRDDIKPYQEAKVKNQKVTFSSLEPGVYLVIGTAKKEKGMIYTPESILVSLPNLEEDWNYQVEANLKYESREETDQKLSKTVLKIWKDEESKDRPNQITVELLKDGEVVESVELSKENDWRYTFSELEANARYQVVEKEVEKGYTVWVSEEKNTYMITNLQEEKKESTGTLPNTGTTWIYAVLFLGMGGIFLLLGLLTRKKHETKE